jgi:hypothetical protein
MALLKSNVAEFNTKILAWGKMHKSGITMNTIVRKLLLDGLVSVTNYTPVDTGYLRYNWTVTIGRPTSEKFGTEGLKTLTYSEPQNLQAEASKAPKAGFNVHYIQNNANYAEPVNNGTPRMEARQMVELAMGDLIMSVNETGVMAV